MTKHIDVVSCVILRDDSMRKLVGKNLTRETAQFLITRRALHTSNGGCWEFPGGKIEFGESDTSGLQRELWEELGIKFEFEQFLSMQPIFECCHNAQDKQINLRYYLLYATLENEQSIKLETNELMEWRWVTTNETKQWMQETYQHNISDTRSSTDRSNIQKQNDLHNFVSPGDIPVLEWLETNEFWKVNYN